VIIYLTATNCPDGNPRRGFAFLEDGRPIAFWPESYASFMAVPDSLHYDARRAMGDGLTVAAAQYGRLCNLPSPSQWPNF